MKAIAAIQFELAVATGRGITAADKTFYRWVAHTLTASDFTIASYSPELSVPISKRTINRTAGGTTIYNRIWDLAASHAIPPPDIFVIDIRGAPSLFRGHLCFQLSRAVAAVIDASNIQLSVDNPTKFVLALPTLPSVEDTAFKALSEAINCGVVVVISHTGQIAPSKRVDSHISVEQLSLALTKIREDPYELLDKKMIRRWGHFQRHGTSTGNKCVRYFFDARNCQREIVALIEDIIRRSAENWSSTCIFYHCPISRPVEDAILAATGHLGINNVYNLLALNADAIKRLRVGATTTCFLVVALVATGATLRSQLTLLGEHSNILPNLEIISVMATTPTETKSRSREFRFRGNVYNIHYMLAVDQLVLSSPCPLCADKVPFSSLLEEDTRMLTALDHWDMAIEVGTKAEEDAPPHRLKPALPRVINYPQMIHRNGAWLAHKVYGLLSLLPGGFPPDPVVVCPESEKGAEVFSEYLAMVLEVQVIRIPRSIIDQFRSPGDGTHTILVDIINTSPMWYKELVSTEQSDVILIDEFIAAGKTFDGLANLMAQLQKNVICFCSFNDLNPIWSERQSIPVYSLYRWQSYNETFVASTL